MTVRDEATGADCDVLIAGGGMVGASLAAALAGLPVRVTLVEQIPMGSPGQPSFDARTTALSRSSQHILATLGIWPEVAEHATPIRRIHVSERGQLGTTVIDADEEGGEALGYVVENRLLGAALWRAISSSPNVTVHSPARVTQVDQSLDHLVVHVGQESATTEIRTRLLVVADGASSPLRASLGIAAKTRPYGQTAIVGSVAVEAPKVGLAYERFTADGPIALLPAGGSRYVFVVTRRSASAEAVFALPDPAFLELLQREFGFRLGRLERVGTRSRYPLGLVETAAVRTHRVAVIGNAAHGLHPVAGQGYNLGLRDAAALAELVARPEAQLVEETGRFDPGQTALLDRYASWRRPDQRKVVAFTDGLIRLFDRNGSGGLFGPLRGLGLLLFDNAPGAKRLLARQTMGLAGRRTRLSRGLPL